jgi:hypothetical protein
LEIDFDAAIKNGSCIFKSPSWYGKLLYLGQQNEYPIFTLTNEHDLQTPTRPSENYVRAISEGIKEAHHFDNVTILQYLRTKKGIDGNYTDEELLRIIDRKLI